MLTPKAPRPAFPGAKKPPRLIELKSEELVESELWPQEQGFLRRYRARNGDVNIFAWLEENRSPLLRNLEENGAVLLSGFGVNGIEEFARAARIVFPELLDYPERAAQRHEVAPQIFTSTEMAADQAIPLHHEMSYSHQWPAKLCFFCERPPRSGGRTPVADDRRIFRLLDPRIKRRFMEKKVRYIRNFRPGFDTWQEAFQTERPAEVEAYCRRWSIDWEWLAPDHLRTSQVRQAVAAHPKTGETVWFNHAHMFHPSNLAPDVREALLRIHGEENLPRNALFGDGSPLDEEELEEIRGLYWREAVRFDWQAGDLLILDNFLTTHGREPYGGDRRILVAMAELFINRELGL